MGENTKIEWCHHSFNPWYGCQKVGPGCDHCYAEGWAKRSGLVQWGPGTERRRSSPANWRKPLAWNAEAERLGVRHRVFCASLADVFDNEVPRQWRIDLFRLILETPSLDWLLLTKRIGNAAKMLQDTAECIGPMMDANDRYRPLPNVWLGATICNQAEADRDIPKLLAVPARVRFLSMEPLLGPVDLLYWIEPTLECAACGAQYGLDEKVPAEDGYHWGADKCARCGHENIMGTVWGQEAAEEGCPEGQELDRWDHGYKLHWVVVGGESSSHARPMHPDWVRSLRDQCAAAGVAFHFKQWGEWAPLADHPEFDVHGVVKNPLPDGMGPSNAAATNHVWMAKIGKKAAGRLLDGSLHDSYPEDRR